MYGYIYLTENLINHKKYIGKHKASVFDESYKGSGVTLSKAIDKYGWDNFSCIVLKECASREELNLAEIEFISKFNAIHDSSFYNIAVGGEGGDTYSGMTFESKVAFSNKVSERWSVDSYKETTANKISKALTGKSKSKEHCANISKTRKIKGLSAGKNNSMYGTSRRGKAAPTYGYHYYNDGINEVFVPESTYEVKYKLNGFVKGRLKSNLDRLHKNISTRSKTNKSTLGKIIINKDGVEKRVFPNDLEKFLEAGWFKGRKSINLSK